jgi:hypothetical protein
VQPSEPDGPVVLVPCEPPEGSVDWPHIGLREAFLFADAQGCPCAPSGLPPRWRTSCYIPALPRLRIRGRRVGHPLTTGCPGARADAGCSRAQHDDGRSRRLGEYVGISSLASIGDLPTCLDQHPEALYVALQRSWNEADCGNYCLVHAVKSDGDGKRFLCWRSVCQHAQHDKSDPPYARFLTSTGPSGSGRLPPS